MSIAVLQDKIRARKTPLALVLSPEADKLNPKITKNFTDLYGPGDMAEAEALRYHGSQLIVATHSPILLGLPGARIISFDDGELHEIGYEETESYQVTELFINNRERILHELLEPRV